MNPPVSPEAAPPDHAALIALPLGSIRPAGWLLEQLQLQADGLTGHLEEMWSDVGPDSAWLGGDGEAWERGPYYLDGLIPLAHALKDPALIAKAGRWVEAILSSQRPDGFFGPPQNDDWWARMPALKALAQHYEATRDGRVLDFMTRYFRHQEGALPERPLSEWGEARGAENALMTLWLHRQTGDAFLLDLTDLLLAQTFDWDTYLTEHLPPGPVASFSHATHVVNVAMGLKLPALRFLQDGDMRHLETLHRALDNLDRLHGMPNGMFSGDEWLAGLGPQRGVETCAVVELMYSLEVAARAFGDAALADRLEVVAFNALPAAMGADMKTHQYHQQVNQVLCTVAQRDWTYSSDDANTFGLEPHFGCCTANLHQGWPKYVASLWARRPDGGLVALSYAPNTVTTTLGGGVVEIETRTLHPFDDSVQMTFRLGRPQTFRLELRVPAWCSEAQVQIGGQSVQPSTDQTGILVLEREWHDADTLTLRLPVCVRAQARPEGALALSYGPLTLAFAPGEIWSRIEDSRGQSGFGDYEVRPRRSWNYGLNLPSLEPEALAAACRVEHFALPSPPFSHRIAAPPTGVEAVGLRVTVPMRMLPDWTLEGNSAAAPPAGASSELPTFSAPLIPYGCARLRVAEFPRVGSTVAHTDMADTDAAPVGAR